MSRVWATGREPFGLMPVSAAKAVTSSTMISHVSQVTLLLLPHALAFALTPPFAVNRSASQKPRGGVALAKLDHPLDDDEDTVITEHPRNGASLSLSTARSPKAMSQPVFTRAAGGPYSLVWTQSVVFVDAVNSHPCRHDLSGAIAFNSQLPMSNVSELPCAPQVIMPRVVQAGTRDADRRESGSQPPDVPAQCGGRTIVPPSALAARESQDQGLRAGDLDCNEGSTRPGRAADAVH